MLFEAHRQAIETVKENIAADLQAMVGASLDERALSSSLFAVKTPTMATNQPAHWFFSGSCPRLI